MSLLAGLSGKLRDGNTDAPWKGPINRSWREGYKGQITESRAKKYGLSLEELHRLLDREACDLCGTQSPFPNPRAAGRWAIDHDHRTGQVRGLLCWFCNCVFLPLMETEGGVGHLRFRMEMAKAYLLRPPGVPADRYAGLRIRHEVRREPGRTKYGVLWRGGAGRWRRRQVRRPTGKGSP